MSLSGAELDSRKKHIGEVIDAIGYKPAFTFVGHVDTRDVWTRRADDNLANEVWDVSESHRISLQLKVERPDTFTGADAVGYGHSIDATDLSDSQLVRAVFGAILAFEEHETREEFTFRGRRVFGPHLDVEALWSVAEQYSTEVPIDAELVET